ncbi:hypothetical protein EJ07DRAFT_151875 [Lizonia empirigonia]|nr:hypothetical protein EJ07DRAFT_151875 [Lizonia empirigonia]
MWTLENHSHGRGRAFARKSPVLRDYSCSPPRTPDVPSHTPLGFIVHGTPGARDEDGYFPLPVATTADHNTSTSSEHAGTKMSTNSDSSIPAPAEIETEKIDVSSRAVDPDVLDLWTAFGAEIQTDLSSTATEPTTPSEDIGKPDGEIASSSNLQHVIPESSNHSFDEPFIFDTSFAPAHISEHKNKRPALSPGTGYISPRAVIAESDLRTTNSSKSMYHNAKATGVHFLSKLLDSPKVDIVNEATDEPYVKGVSLYMLQFFCGIDTIALLLVNSKRSSQITVPASHASKDGIIRVIRYMRRWCISPSIRPTGELHTPPSIKECIATSRACRFFGLDVDAERVENLAVNDFMGSPEFFITDEDVELICCDYEGNLKDTPFGDAIVWFILANVASGNHALADEVRWLLEQEEYEDLKARVRDEMKKKEWRKLGRKEFLAQFQRKRKAVVALDDPGNNSFIQGSSTVLKEGGISGSDKALPSLPGTF